ncbi:MAG: phosphotransferase family protein [Kiloniellaceae bacterium]
MTATPGERRFAESRRALEGFLAASADARTARLAEVRPLGGGAIQENWLLDVDFAGGPFAGRQALVLRTDSPSAVAASLSRAHEFAVLRAAWSAGVAVPEPLWLCDDPAVLGKPFHVMRRAAGIALGRRIVKDSSLGGDRTALAERLGEELAKIHAIAPPRADLGFLEIPSPDPARFAVNRYRAYLDVLGAPRPGLEWGLRWCELHAPPPGEVVLVHQDFRTGNYMLDEAGLTGILDWEFCAWGDPMSDVAWFCAKCWRFGRNDLEAGGIAPREPFYRGYERASGRAVDPERVAYWEVMAHIRWAVIALQQGERTLSGGEHSLELALTGRVYPPELELEILELTPPRRWSAA